MKPSEIFLMTQKGIDRTPENLKGKYSDGYHTFDELYEFRKILTAHLFSEIQRRKNTEQVHKSIRHNDGELCFGGGWFIVCANLPTGQISFHYKMEDWELFDIPAKEKALFKFDGHTSQDVLKRLMDWFKPYGIYKEHNKQYDGTGNI